MRTLQSPLEEVLGTLLFKSEQRLTKTFNGGDAYIAFYFENQADVGVELNRLNLLSTLLEKAVPNAYTAVPIEVPLLV